MEDLRHQGASVKVRESPIGRAEKHLHSLHRRQRLPICFCASVPSKNALPCVPICNGPVNQVLRVLALRRLPRRLRPEKSPRRPRERRGLIRLEFCRSGQPAVQHHCQLLAGNSAAGIEGRSGGAAHITILPSPDDFVVSPAAFAHVGKGQCLRGLHEDCVNSDLAAGHGERIAANRDLAGEYVPFHKVIAAVGCGGKLDEGAGA